MKTKRILIPIDFSPCSIHALKEAVFFARIAQAELLLVHVVQNLLGNSELQAIMPGQNSLRDALIEQIEKQFDEVITEYCSGVQLSYRIENGSAYRWAVQLAKEEPCQMIFMGTNGASGMQARLLGTNADRVVSLASCPVITIREPKETVGYKRIVMPIDTSKYSRQKVDLAIEISKIANSKLFVLGVSTLSDDQTAHQLKVLTTQVAETLAQNQVDYDVNHILGQNLTEATLSHAYNNNADLIIIMTEQEPSIEALFLGEYAMQMVHQSTIPVLSMRPKPVDGNVIIGY